MGKSEIKVSCKDQVLKITEAPVLAAGGLNEVRVVFSFCEKWVGFIKTAIFYRDEEEVYYAVLDENDTCLVPWEVCYEEGTFYFGVFGERDNTRRTSNVVRYKVKKGAITSDMKPSAPPPDVYEQIMTEVAKVKEATKYNIAGAKAYQIIDKGAMDTLVNGRQPDGYYLLCADEVPIEELTGQDYSITIQTTYELAGKIVGVGQIETGLTGIDGNGNPVSGLTGFKVYVTGYKDDVLLDNTSQYWNETRNTFRIPYLPHLGTKDYGKGAWAEGLNTMAVAPGAHSEGSGTKTLGKYGHSEGLGTVSLYCGHSEGAYTEAHDISHSEGYYTKALGTGSHSAGAYTVAEGDYSHTGGMFTHARHEAQTAFGRYNLNKQDTLFEVGVGSGEFDRVNGLEVKKDGSARVLTESTEPDAVVRYSQLERTAVGFTNVVDTAISLDFEADAVGQTPAGWTEVTPSTDPEKYYVNVVDDSGNQVLRVNSVNAPGVDYFVQYSLPEKVTNLKLEYKVKLEYVTPDAYELYLPSINYAGVATNSNNNSTPLRLWVSNGYKLWYSFTDASARVEIPGTYDNSRWYKIRMEVDLRAGTRTLSVGTDSETLAQLTLPMTNAEAADWSTATIDRISTGAYSYYGGSLLFDDIKLSWERKSEPCALTVVKNGEVYQLYPKTEKVTPEQIGAAPGGYGLGGQATNIGDNLDNIVTNGWYCYNSGTCVNVPEDKPSLLFVESFYNTNYCKQTVTILSTGKVYTRMRNNGTWGAWESLKDDLIGYGQYCFLPEGRYLNITDISGLNNIFNNGCYRLSSNPQITANGQRIDILVHFNVSTSTCVQLAFDYSGTVMQYRGCWYGTWYNWMLATASRV